MPELLDQGRAGVLVPPGDPVELAVAIRGLRADPARRGELASTGRHRAVSNYEWSSVVADALSLVDLSLNHNRMPEVAYARA